MTMTLSIIILNYKQANLIKYQLKKLYHYNFEFDSEIIVIDNNSHDDIQEIIIADFPKVKFIKSKNNLGYAGGNNLGIKRAQGNYILILNPDIRISQESIQKMLDFLKKNPTVGLIAPRLINADKTTQETCFQFPNWQYPLFRRTGFGKTKSGKKWLAKFLIKDFDHKSTRKVDWIMGACWMANKKTIQEIEYLDKNYFMYLEDMDLCRRLWNKNKAVYYLGEISAIHLHQKASENKNIIYSLFFNKLSRIHLKSWFYYIKKWRGQKLPAPTLKK